MAKLQCDICGGKLTGKAGGVFECESCGMEYDESWAKQKIQEIKGTVRVEGAVQVEGTVTVAGSATAENFVKRGNMAMTDREFLAAKEYFDQALNIDAECAEAYWGKFCVECRRPADQLTGMYSEDLLSMKNCSKDYARAKQFASSPLKEQLEQFEKRLEEKAATDKAIRLEKEEIEKRQWQEKEKLLNKEREKKQREEEIKRLTSEIEELKASLETHQHRQTAFDANWVVIFFIATGVFMVIVGLIAALWWGVLSGIAEIVLGVWLGKPNKNQVEYERRMITYCQDEIKCKQERLGALKNQKE